MPHRAGRGKSSSPGAGYLATPTTRAPSGSTPTAARRSSFPEAAARRPGANEAAFTVALTATATSVSPSAGGDLMVPGQGPGSLDTRFGSARGRRRLRRRGRGLQPRRRTAASILQPEGPSTPPAWSLRFARFLKDVRPDPFFVTEGRPVRARVNGGNVAGAVRSRFRSRVARADDGGTVFSSALTQTATRTLLRTAGPRALAARHPLHPRPPDRSIGVVAQPTARGSYQPHGRRCFAIAKGGRRRRPRLRRNGVSISDFGGVRRPPPDPPQAPPDPRARHHDRRWLPDRRLRDRGGGLSPHFGEGAAYARPCRPTEPRAADRDLVSRAFGSITSDGRLVGGQSTSVRAAVPSTHCQLNVRAPADGRVRQTGSGRQRARRARSRTPTARS